MKAVLLSLSLFFYFQQTHSMENVLTSLKEHADLLESSPDLKGQFIHEIQLGEVLFLPKNQC